jgi:hypothetical protein
MIRPARLASMFHGLLGLALVALPGPCLAEASFEDGLRSKLNKLNDEAMPGVAVLVARDGKIVFEDAFGLAEVEKKTPLTAATTFRIGSDRVPDKLTPQTFAGVIVGKAMADALERRLRAARTAHPSA